MFAKPNIEHCNFPLRQKHESNEGRAQGSQLTPGSSGAPRMDDWLDSGGGHHLRSKAIPRKHSVAQPQSRPPLQTYYPSRALSSLAAALAALPFKLLSLSSHAASSCAFFAAASAAEASADDLPSPAGGRSRQKI